MSSDKIVNSKRFQKAVLKVLNIHDPVGLIADGAPDNEYEYQQAAIVRKLPNCRSILETQQMLHDEFCHWFNPEKAGPIDKYRIPATELYRLLRSFRNRD